MGLFMRKGHVHLTTHTAFRPVAQVEKDLLRKINNTPPGTWLPTVRFDKSGPQYRRNALSARNIDRVTDLFLPRNLLALGLLWNSIQKANDARLRSACEFAFTALVMRASRLNRLRPSGAGDPQLGTIYISSLTREENIWRLFDTRFSMQ
jgi:hypothetical protein